METDKTYWIKEVVSFIKRFSKELIIASVLAIIAAWAYEEIKVKIHHAAIDHNRKAIATIENYNKDGRLISQGSGFFIDSKGTLVTNYHVIKKAHLPFTIAKLPSGAYYKLKSPKGIDETTDIAVLQFEANETPFVKMGNSDTIERGQKVFTISVPLGLEGSFSEGVISDPKRKLDGREFIQFTAPISPGSSGGGLFTEKGEEVIGITTLSLIEPRENRAQMLNLAVPINILKNVVDGKEKSFIEDSPEYWYANGTLAKNAGDYDKAIKYFMMAIEKDDKYVYAYIDLGSVLYEKGLYEQELKVLNIAAQLEPKNSNAYYYLAQAYEDSGIYNSAIAAYKRVIELNPNDKDAIYSLGILYIAQGEKDKAVELIPRLSKLNVGLGNLLNAVAERTN